MVISVVVPSHDRPHRLRALLDALAAQSLPSGRWEAVVVSDDGPGPTEDALRDHGLAAAGVLRHRSLAPGTGTVRDNIAFAKPEATDDEIRAAAATVCGLGVLERLPEGLDTRVGEGGTTLSVGENQLIALARVVLADPRLVILDEATRCFGAETESEIQAGLERFLATRTALVVAHRLTTVRDADTIVAIKDGRVVESGTHDELLAAGGLYQAFYAAWTQAGAVA